jgi:hypothetical protein
VAIAPLVGKEGTLVAHKLSIRGADDQDHIILAAMTDDGVSIDPAAAKRLFELPVRKSGAVDVRFIEKSIFAECALELDRKEVTGGTGSVSSGHIPFLAKLIARDTNLGRTHLFTLNYDTLFEQAMEELGIQYFDGFSGKANSRFDPAVYGLDVYYPGDVAEGRVRRSPTTSACPSAASI